MKKEITREQKNKLIEIILDKSCLKEYNLSLLKSIEIKLDDVKITISESDIQEYQKGLQTEE